jgi:hypothetical protein
MTIITERPKRATATEVAQKVRHDLKLAFPGVRFSVKTRNRGTDAVVVHWQDGPTTDRVNAIVSCYQLGEFDGMTDSYTYHGGKMVNGVEHGVRWIQTQRNMSDAAETRFMALIMQYRGDLDGKPDYEIANLAWREFVRWDGCKDDLPATTSDLPSARNWRTTR